jgi:hypothetical protein
MGGLRPEGHITDPSNTRTKKMNRKQRRLEVSSEGRSGPRKGYNVTDGMEKERKVALPLGVSLGTSVFPLSVPFHHCSTPTFDSLPTTLYNINNGHERQVIQ